MQLTAQRIINLGSGDKKQRGESEQGHNMVCLAPPAATTPHPMPMILSVT